jgi:hypothetical protein
VGDAPALYAALEHAGLHRIRFHDLRHTFGTDDGKISEEWPPTTWRRFGSQLGSFTLGRLRRRSAIPSSIRRPNVASGWRNLLTEDCYTNEGERPTS